MSGIPDGLPRVLSERYELERLLGRGGMAAVYLARDRKHDRRVALKVLDAELSHTLGAQRFLREISIAANLTHPHILPLHDSGEVDGALFYVMPYVEGETLRDRLNRERQLPVADALRITCEVASALDYAHRENILHRDIKPENILLEDGHAILADFGIARAVDDALGSRVTATGITLGTPAYMSPEQVDADPALDGRSDLYSLACVLYEMLAGEPPFTGPTAHSIMAKRLGGPPPKITTVRRAVGEGVERALLRALDTTPADRFATAGEFRQALLACGQDAARPSRIPRRKALLGAAAVVVLTALAWPLKEVVAPRLAASDDALTIAVLPFASEGDDPEQAYLAHGLADAMIADLVREPGVRVISRMSAIQYAGMGKGGSMGGMKPMSGGMSFMTDASAKPAAPDGAGAMQMGSMSQRPTAPDEIARELHADILLHGTLSRVGDTIRVSASVSRAGAPKAEPRMYVRHVHDLFLLQQDLREAILASTPRKATPEEAAPARAYAPDAHQAYVRGAYFQAHWKLSQAVAQFERAVELDPTHAPAQAALARAYYFLAFFGDIPPSVALAAMRRAATAALAQDSLIADAHAQLALVKMLQDWDWEGADRSFQRALELGPGDAQIRHDYAHFLLGQGRQLESVQQTRQAVALDPVNPMLISCLGWHSLFDSHFEDAIGFAVESNNLMPDFWAQVVLGWARLGKGEGDAAVAAFREGVRLHENGFTLAALGHGLAVTGRAAEARKVLEQLLRRADREYVSSYDIASVYAGLRDADGALRWLRRAAEERSTFIVHVGWDSRFEGLRKDARFADLTSREMRLPARRYAVLPDNDRRLR